MKRKRKSLLKNKNFLIVGLGNPGEEYARTRHNAGFLVIDRLTERFGCSLKKPLLRNFFLGSCMLDNTVFHLVKPLTYMNRSGFMLDSLLRKTGRTTEDLLVICDTLDLPAGTIRMKPKGGSAGQKGLASIIEFAGTGDFPRIYVGIGRPDNKDEIVDYVLGTPGEEEQEAFYGGIELAAEAVSALADKSVLQVMNEFNKKR